MSERITDRDSVDILFNSMSVKKQKMSDTEKEYYSYYLKVYKVYISSYGNISTLSTLIKNEEKMRENALNDQLHTVLDGINRSIANLISWKTENEKKEEQSRKLLASLEATTPIQNILQRERWPQEIITLRFLHTELTNIPFNVIGSQQLLSEEDISLIKSIEPLGTLPPNKSNDFVKQKELINTENIKRKLREREEARIKSEIERQENRDKIHKFLLYILPSIVSFLLIFLIVLIANNI